ncbi:alpha-2-macroglobulin family protein [Ruegeria sp. 2205SS24-7]|uniref:alpha-2-macroglobulin family protein n=1 Tax=Ruegeria discodermiae TaxID=3064389 RepID=UPI002741C0D7|nr:alpha-2-macroglobulin family protein [Ruegeria sp. 2205SS24-7]MDP5220660.1 alpha-2-macroglobulin family protein [Ruegeria sp. 2205SS24-7]
MHRFVFFLTALIVSFEGISPQPAHAETSAYRYVVTRDADFYGSDLDALFDTDLNSCVRACSANASCTAFTFNSRSDACFPKMGVEKTEPYLGAISARKVATDAGILELSLARARELEFLQRADFDRAQVQARDLGLLYPAGGLTLGNVLQALSVAENRDQELRWTGRAVSLGDRWDLWADYARLLMAGKDRNDRLPALSAAINGYLRAGTPPEQANALTRMAAALEWNERGRDMVSALRMASDIQPHEDVLAALDTAIGKYGFRITDSQVDSNAATPRICAQFSEPLVKAGVDYETYVQLPEPYLVVQTEERSLCFDGVAHGERYRITFRKGLPAASGEILSKDVELTHYVRDRGPSVRFPGRSYVLPKIADAALPVETVNLTELNLQLRRISDRNLLRVVQDGFFGRPLSRWQDQQFSKEIAQEVWTGTAQVESELNRDMTTRLPMAEAIADQPPGIYALRARVPGVDPYDDPGATQWFALSDLGISSKTGTDGLHVTVLGLADAQPRSDVEISLISQANSVIATAQTDDQGYARFEPGLTRGRGAGAPALILAAQGEIDFNFLSLTDPAFDLSDRGVEGRAPAGPVDVFLTTDRGAYRAGETIHVTALARDGTAQAIDGLPLTAILSRPDGVEYRRIVSDRGMAGGHVFAVPVSADVPRGTWRIEVKSDPEGAALASQTVLVEDFLPERIDFDLSLPNAPLRPGDSPPLRIDATYLFGAPGSDLSINGQVSLRSAEELDGYDGYRFGRYDAESRIQASQFGDARTDAQGQATVPVEIPLSQIEGKPLEATVTARLADGSGRPVERQLVVPIRPQAPVIGIRPQFDGVVSEGTEATFQVIGLSPDLTPAPMRVRWTLNRIETSYQWYQLYGNWNWEPTTRRTRIASDKADLGTEPLALAQPVDWGRYELVVERLDGAYAAAALDFRAGWYGAEDSSTTPDRLEMSLDRADYRVGDTAQLRLVPRMSGIAQIEVLSDRLIARRTMPVAAGETVVPLTITEDWGTGVYVTATVIRPMDVAAGHNPARAMGVAHATVDPAERALEVTIEAPETATPRNTQKIRIGVENVPADETVWLTIASVDVGILNLTGFDSPDLRGHYFGQRRLGVELRDVYGRLIDGMNGALGTVRSGGDANAGMRMQSPPPTQDLMAVFSGPVQLGADGAAEIDLPLPVFNGTVRMMAVVWSETAIGQAEAEMIVRDPVVVTASLPRFLAPGDESRLRLELAHASGPSGEMPLSVTSSDGLEIGPVPGTVTLDKGGKALLDIPLRAGVPGDLVIAITLTPPGGKPLTQNLRMPIRANDPVVSLTRRFSLGTGDSFLFSSDVFADMKPGSAKAMLSAGPIAKFDAAGLLAHLDRYPYGCTEQVTSGAMPLLYLSSVAQASGLGDGPAVDARIATSVERILTRQSANGAFGLWRPASGDFWLDAYVSDFLSRARAQGHAVPDRAFAQAMDNLRNRINYAPDFDKGGEDIAYALLVLAREGAASMGDLRYYADVKGDAFATPLAAAQMGAALAAYGDQTRADAMFARAAAMLSRRTGTEPAIWRADYGTDLRDTAAVLALASEVGSAAVDLDALVHRVTAPIDRPSTQEAVWSLMAAHALISAPESAGLRLNGAAVDGPFVQVLDDSTSEPINITAADSQSTDITLTVTGVPRVPPEAGGTGYAITRAYYTMDGTPIEGNSFAVGDRFVTVLTVAPSETGGARLAVDDPLPAGIEIDNPSLLRSGDVRALDWLSLSDATHTEFRSDRFLAAVDLTGSAPVTLAYVARAVSPGTFHHPAASVEDMYRPSYRARTGTAQVVVR